MRSVTVQSPDSWNKFRQMETYSSCRVLPLILEPELECLWHAWSVIWYVHRVVRSCMSWLDHLVWKAEDSNGVDLDVRRWGATIFTSLQNFDYNPSPELYTDQRQSVGFSTVTVENKSAEIKHSLFLPTYKQAKALQHSQLTWETRKGAAKKLHELWFEKLYFCSLYFYSEYTFKHTFFFLA